MRRGSALGGLSSSVSSWRRTLSTQLNVRFILLCALWYSSSALSSNTGKQILMQFRYPITLTFVQFGFVAGYCLLCMTPWLRLSTLRRPTRAIIMNTLPMGMFQVGGHVFSSMAISRIPVSTVHTIKALSPLFTVAAYALLFGVSYSNKTYISLIPLTLGVMLACSSHFSGSDLVGLLCAFGSALVFVSSNIFFKKIMPSHGTTTTSDISHKLDKLNLLLYSSGMAFLLMIPIWCYYDLPLLFFPASPTYVAHPPHPSTHGVTFYFIANGTVHFAQNLIAFIILSSTSPVTYSIASLIKRVAVICIAIVWFAQPVHLMQGIGIALTFAGLWLYNSAKGSVERGETKMRMVEARRDMVLPVTKTDANLINGRPPVPVSIEKIPSAESTAMKTTTTGRPRAPSSAARLMQQQQQHQQHGHYNSYNHNVRYGHGQTHGRAPSHNPKNLSVKISPPSLNPRVTVSASPYTAKPEHGHHSPTEIYPSPPLSPNSENAQIRVGA